MGKTYKSTKETFTPDGEIVRTVKWHTKAETIREFVKLMVDEVDHLFKLTRGEYQVLFAAIKEVRFESFIIANKDFRERIAGKIGKEADTIATILSSLADKKIIHRINKGYYELNPEILWKGDEIGRMKRVEYHKVIEMENKYGKKEKISDNT